VQFLLPEIILPSDVVVKVSWMLTHVPKLMQAGILYLKSIHLFKLVKLNDDALSFFNCLVGIPGAKQDVPPSFVLVMIPKFPTQLSFYSHRKPCLIIQFIKYFQVN